MLNLAKAQHNNQINITLGTAGHIDHGKTALIGNLTGCETDRLKIEKQRGMSIELGFAPCRIADLEVGIVDVPGHENFIKTMVAGAGSIDGVIFVVAADDGVMPQTREHLDILTLLGVKYGVVALTKIDVVSAEQLELKIQELKDYLYGTFLQDSAILPLSNITGAGFGEFYDGLKEMVANIKPRQSDGVFRMPVENSFSIKGFGTIISGIPISGSAKTGDEVVLLPGNIKSRIKTIQVYSHLAEKVQAGQCAAVGLPQLDYKLVQRGSTIAAVDYFQEQSWFLGQMQILHKDKLSLKNGTPVKLHTGTTEAIATIYFNSADILLAGQSDTVQFRCKEPIVAGPDDKFIIRSMSPVATIGGGRIICSLDKRIKRTDNKAMTEIKALVMAFDCEKDVVAFYIKKSGTILTGLEKIAKQSKKPLIKVEEITKELLKDGTIVEVIAGHYGHRATIENIWENTIDKVRLYHQSQPQSPGMPDDKIHQDFGLSKKVFDAVLLANNDIIINGERLVLADFKPAVSDKLQEKLAKIEKAFLREPFSPPGIDELAGLSAMSEKEVNETLKILKDTKVLIEIQRNMFFHHQAIEQARQMIIDYIKNKGGLESVQFKYLLQTTRKFAIPLLDYFDNIGLTRRDGYTRLLRAKH